MDGFVDVHSGASSCAHAHASQDQKAGQTDAAGGPAHRPTVTDQAESLVRDRLPDPPKTIMSQDNHVKEGLNKEVALPRFWLLQAWGDANGF